MPFIIGGLALAGTLGGAALSANASRKGASEQADAANLAAQNQQAQFNQTQANLSPYLQAGNLALKDLMLLSGTQQVIPYQPPAGARPGQPGQAQGQPSQFPGQPAAGGQASVSVSQLRSPASRSGVPTFEEWKRIYQQHNQVARENGQPLPYPAMGLPPAPKPAPAAPPNQGQPGLGEPAHVGVPPIPPDYSLPLQSTDPTAGGQFNANAPLVKPYGEAPPPVENFTLQDFQQSPAYQFNLEQGQQAINKASAARNAGGRGYYAPQTLQDLSKFSQGLASNEFLNASNMFNANRAFGSSEYLNRYNQYNQNQQNVWNRLFSMSGMGQQAAVQQGAFGANAANTSGGFLTDAAAARAGGQVGQANAWNDALGQIGRGAQQSIALSQLQRPIYGGANTANQWQTQNVPGL